MAGNLRYNNPTTQQVSQANNSTTFLLFLFFYYYFHTSIKKTNKNMSGDYPAGVPSSPRNYDSAGLRKQLQQLGLRASIVIAIYYCFQLLIFF